MMYFLLFCFIFASGLGGIMVKNPPKNNKEIFL